jgi:hypothetical protein
MALLPTFDIRLQQCPEMIPEAFGDPDHPQDLIPTWSGDPCVLVQCASDLVEAPADTAELGDGTPELGELLTWQWRQHA